MRYADRTSVAIAGLGVVLAAATLWLTRDRGPPSEAAQSYLSTAIGLIRENHLDTAKVDWPKVTQEAERKIRGARNPSETYPAIRYVLSAAGESHSFLLEPEMARETAAKQESSVPHTSGDLPTAAIVDQRIGLVRLPMLMDAPGESHNLSKSYASTLRFYLQKLDQSAACGWIVDLRGNGGGNMWPMLEGLDPLLGAPPFGAFVDRRGRSEPWDRSAGVYQAVRTMRTSYTLKGADRPIAVLLDHNTGSSGEMAAISLIGRHDVRTFGESTFGFTTGNAAFPLPDGALLVITSVRVQDRTGKTYSGSITPDVRTAPNAAQVAATAWLEASCRT